VKTRFGPFVLNTETRQVTRDGADVHLSPKAFAILETLLARRPGVVSKDDLFNQVWPDVFVVEGNLTVLVGEIRRALDDDPQSPQFVRTVHGVGYAFCGSATEMPHAAARDDRGGRFWLTLSHQTFALATGDNIIGRDPRCEVWLDHPRVSRRHARIRIDAGRERPSVVDLESTNGTFVRGKRVEEPTPLANGDTITVGEVSVKFREWSDGAQRTKRIRGANRAAARVSGGGE
jgi:DNA-binding winged helix-turn-helix (wHTH) protein